MEAATCKNCGRAIVLCRFRDVGFREPDYDPSDDPVVWRHAAGYAVCSSAGFAEPGGTLTSGMVSAVNRQRSAVWHSEGETWSLADWSNAMCGEAGELANVIKKIRRLETGTNARYSEQDRAALVAKARAEVADVYLYLDLLLEQLDPTVSILDVVADKFNRTSDEYGFDHRLVA